MKKIQKYFSISTFRYLSLLVIIFFVYTFAGKIGLSLAFVNASATTIWAPTGIAIAAMLLFGYRVIPAIFLGAFVTNLTTQGNFLTSVAIAGGNSLEAFVACYLVTRFAGGRNAFSRVRTIAYFLFLAGIVATAVSATVGVLTLFVANLLPPKTFFHVWLIWWLGDIGGAILVAPLILLWAKRRKLSLNLRLLGEFLFFLIVVAITAELIFSGLMPYPYLIIPLLVIGAFRFGQREETITLGIVAIIATIDTLGGKGPFMTHDTTISLLILEFFLVICAATIYIVTAILLERREARSGLESSEKKFRSLIEKSFDAIVLVDPTSKISYASPSVEQILGYKPEELIGMTGFELVLPEDRDYTRKILSQLVLKPGGFMTIQYRSVRKDKKVIWVEVNGTNLLLDGVVNAVVINFHDITDSKLTQEKIEKEKAEDEAILKSIGEGMIATDDTGKIVLVNEAATKMLHLDKTDLIGKNLIEKIPMQDGEERTLPPEERPMTKVLRFGKTIISPQNYYLRKDKTKFPVRFTLTPIKMNNKITGTIEIFRDITREIEVDKAKSEFVSLASHQLRTPLTTINWYIERLANNELGAFPKKQKEYLEEIYHASARMIDLINALLNASRLELGTFIANPVATSIEDAVKRAVGDFKADIIKRKISIVTDMPANLSDMQADPKLLDIVLQNLLSNAIKYSKKESKIYISTSYDIKGYSIKIKDTGIGIPQKDKDKIFSKMFRADNAKEIDRDGTGLGLYIVRSIIDTTGGNISFISEEGKGTTFMIKYPKSGMEEKVGTKELR